MNATELRYADGRPTGIWSCSKCDTIHSGCTTGGGKPASDINQEQAERCCVLGECRFCGKPTQPKTYGGIFDGGFAPNYHEECLPPTKPWNPEPMSLEARLLREWMSEISEEHWCAGWMSGTEYTLWDMLQGGKRDWGMGSVSDSDLDRLRKLHEMAGGWIGYPEERSDGYDGEKFFTTEEWLKHVESANKVMA